MDNLVSSIRSNYWEVLFEWKLLFTFKKKEINISYTIQRTITEKDLPPNTNKKKNLTVKKLSANKKKLLYKFSWKTLCTSRTFFNNTSVYNQFKTKIDNYNTNSFLSSFSLLKYLFVLSLNFIAKEQFISQKAYATEGLSLTRLLALVNKA